jgi:hypothetical protein
MYRKHERGFSFVEFMMVATVVSFVSTGVKTFVFDRDKAPTPRIASNELAGQGRASVEKMVHELELAGNSAQGSASEPIASGPVSLVSSDSDSSGSPFLVAKPDQVVFEADLEGDGVVERVEYRLWESVIWRRAVSADSNDEGSPEQYEIVAEHVDNGDVPLFQYGRDPFGSMTEPSGIRQVWVTLQLRTPATDSHRPQFRTMRFDGLAQRRIGAGTMPVAGLQKP